MTRMFTFRKYGSRPELDLCMDRGSSSVCQYVELYLLPCQHRFFLNEIPHCETQIPAERFVKIYDVNDASLCNNSCFDIRYLFCQVNPPPNRRKRRSGRRSSLRPPQCTAEVLHHAHPRGPGPACAADDLPRVHWEAASFAAGHGCSVVYYFYINDFK